MANNKNDIVWRDRKHHMWFPWSFTVYELKKDKIYQKTGLFNTESDQLKLYHITDVKVKRTLGQRIFGTGTVILYSRVDSNHETYLENIKSPDQVGELLSDLSEEARKKNNVVGREFYSAGVSIDLDSDVMLDED